MVTGYSIQLLLSKHLSLNAEILCPADFFAGILCGSLSVADTHNVPSLLRSRSLTLMFCHWIFVCLFVVFFPKWLLPVLCLLYTVIIGLNFWER